MRLCGGDRRRAMDELRVPERRFVVLDWPTLFAGFCLGIFVVRCAQIC
jgi:hypothetical protein